MPRWQSTTQRPLCYCVKSFNPVILANWSSTEGECRIDLICISLVQIRFVIKGIFITIMYEMLGEKLTATGNKRTGIK